MTDSRRALDSQLKQRVPLGVAVSRSSYTIVNHNDPRILRSIQIPQLRLIDTPETSFHINLVHLHPSISLIPDTTTHRLVRLSLQRHLPSLLPRAFLHDPDQPRCETSLSLRKVDDDVCEVVRVLDESWRCYRCLLELQNGHQLGPSAHGGYDELDSPSSRPISVAARATSKGKYRIQALVPRP